ncbi:MAG TPA: PRC-barrel domain-containing protein [Gemmatimonadaceae bacterium]|nr:PRC-barrel domain-containing protein [Gemmatimonadaceae bacterium]
MLDKATTLNGFALRALDGAIGSVKEFYFDDQHWGVRYLVAATGNWLTGRQVLISPYALHAVNRDAQEVAVALTKQQIGDSPALDRHRPVSRQFEEAYYGFYGWPRYWGGPNLWGFSPVIVRDPELWREASASARAWDPHLRSTKVVTGYHVQAADGEIGHVEDFIIDDETWAIRYLVIDTGNWRAGKKVLVAPEWIERVSWSDAEVYVTLARAAIEQSPEYTDESALTRDYETALHGHYDRRGYWVDGAGVPAPRR